MCYFHNDQLEQRQNSLYLLYNHGAALSVELVFGFTLWLSEEKQLGHASHSASAYCCLV